MAAEPRRPVMSVQEYLALEHESINVRYEYIDGHIDMMAGGTANQATISINIISLLHNLLRDGPCRVYNSDLRVRLSATRYVYPDASVTCDARDRGRVDTVQ